ncbi:mechanosensitive ion channel family protein [Kovacikia minuta CCNUW1]|uniref:mechanosensitive ion channel family protein n=1 Tax=Kovacikia minuta TaxID=2931930 RepID=UPI001CC928E3|nr:mechanosensitive ion channel family protein [Kovacikia minuta]UBF24852.1 mechanosensitive ion channel family protein [Kovacikia minuta CCNUW1]
MVSFQRVQRLTIQFGVISLITIVLVLGWGAIAQSQLPALPSGAANNAFNPPADVSRHGEYETAAIKSPLDGQKLFEVTSPTILNRDKIPDGLLPVEVRAEEVNERLWRVLYRTFSAKQTSVVTIATLNNRPIIQISDDQSSRPIRLVTVTEPDADFNGKTLTELAQAWQAILQTEVAQFKQLTTPEVVRQRLGQALQILLGLLVASVIIWFLRRLLTRRQQTLERQYQAQLAASTMPLTNTDAKKAQPSELTVPSELTQSEPIPSEPIAGEDTKAREMADVRSRFLATLQHQFSVKRRLEIDKFLQWALFWILILMWYIGIARIISIIPLLMRWSNYIWATPLALIAIWFGISLAIRISRSFIDRLLHSWKISPLTPLAEAQRIALRSTTIAEALKGLATFVLIAIGIIWTLGLFNVPTSSILAGGAIVGLAISFGSQSLIKDLVNGCLILIEDQFAVGDVIKIGEKSGLVENLNLRVTQLRNGEGQLITIPNSTITDVSNLTRLWSRVDFSIVVAYENDPKQVLEVLRQVSQELYSETAWRDRLLESPEVLGIDDLSHTGMLVRVWLKTAPMQQWSVGREFRLRVRQAFEANNIAIGKPQSITYSMNSTKALLQD